MGRATDNPYAGSFAIAPRLSASLPGSLFASTILPLKDAVACEKAIEQQLLGGNVPEFLRTGIPVPVADGRRKGVFWAAADYLSVGTDADYLRVPLSGRVAKRVREAFGAVLPTRKMVDAIWLHAAVRLAPRPLPPTNAMSSVSYFLRHNEIIQEQLDGRGPADLVAGHKKDLVLCPSMRQGAVAIYGWHRPTGIPIQGGERRAVQVKAHDDRYVDYSHGVRLIAEDMLVDDVFMRIVDVLQDDALAGLLSDEGRFASSFFE